MDEDFKSAVEKFSKYSLEMSKNLKAQLQPFLDAQELMRKTMQPLVDAQKAFQESLTPIIKQYQDTQFQESFKKFFEDLQKSYDTLPFYMREAVLLFGDYGWYLDLGMTFPEIKELKKAFAEGDVKNAEDYLIKHLEGRLDEIETFIIEKFPSRAHLIKSAFSAHRRGEYDLSIPVLLAQTDGICKELFDQYLFRSKDSKPCTAIYVEQMSGDAHSAALLSPLAQTLPINITERHRKGDEFNRHTVLHGESLDYGTRINGFKTISLINYVVRIFFNVEEDKASMAKAASSSGKRVT